MEALRTFPQDLFLVQAVLETLATLTESGKLLPHHWSTEDTLAHTVVYMSISVRCLDRLSSAEVGLLCAHNRGGCLPTRLSPKPQYMHRQTCTSYLPPCPTFFLPSFYIFHFFLTLISFLPSPSSPSVPFSSSPPPLLPPPPVSTLSSVHWRLQSVCCPA